MPKLKKCPKCATYTLKPKCPKCKTPTKPPGQKFRNRFVKKDNSDIEIIRQ